MNEFSSGYYEASMDIQEYSEGPAIEAGLYEYINRNLYRQTNAPVSMRVGLDGGPIFSPRPEIAMPTNVLGLPDDLIAESNTYPSRDELVFVLKPEFAFLVNSHG